MSEYDLGYDSVRKLDLSVTLNTVSGVVRQWERTYDRAVEFLDAVEPSDAHQNIQIRKQRLHYVAHTCLAHHTEAPDPQAADEDELGSQGECLDNVAGSAHSGVVHDVDLVADGLRDVLQRVQARDRAVNLPPGVVAHHDSVNAVLDALLRVRDGLDALDGEGTSA